MGAQLGHAGRDRLPAAAHQHGRAARRTHRGRVARMRDAMRCRLHASLAAAALLAAAGVSARADPVADFYAGKTVRILVGFSAGGGYDLYARTLGRYLGKHIPGQPTVVVQNMPGAGSLK